MLNKKTPGLIVAIIAILASLLAGSCSSVFTSSINGTVIDAEQYTDGTTTGVADTKVFLYTDEEAWTADYAAFVEGDETTLPDSATKTSFNYFQSTVTDANGAYQFSGFVWNTFFPKYGKTADRRQIYLLFYNKDYGIAKNPVPLFIVSDVTAQLDMIKLTDLWNDGRMAGKVLNWKDSKGLQGVAVNFYIAKYWEFDDAGAYTKVEYPETPTATATTDNDGKWTADIRFPMKPTRAADKGKAPMRITYTRADYRLNDPADGTGFSNTQISTDLDINRDGKTAAEKDWADAYQVSEILTKQVKPVITLANVTMQRWRFTANVTGRVHDGAATNTRIYYNGKEAWLTVPNKTTGTVYKDISGSQTVGETTTDGHLNLGTVEWFITDVTDLTSPVDGVTDEQKSGKVTMSCTMKNATIVAPLPPVAMDPDVNLTLDLKVTVP